MPNIVRRESQIIRKGDDPVADEAVSKISHLWKVLEKSLEKSLEYRFKIGQYLIEYFFEGDIENAQLNKFAPNKQNSYANMLKHENLPPQCKSPMAISNLIYSSAVYEGLIKRGLPIKEHIKKKEITYTHFVILARIKKTIQLEDKKYRILDFDEIEKEAKRVIEDKRSTAELQTTVAIYNHYLDAPDDIDAVEEIPRLFDLNKELLSPLDDRFFSDWDKFFAYHPTSKENYIIPERVNEMKGQIQKAIKNYNAAIGHLRGALARIEMRKFIHEDWEQKTEEPSVIIDEPESAIDDKPMIAMARR